MKRVKRIDYDRYLLLNWKKLVGIIAAWAAAVFLHNAVYGLFLDYFRRTGSDEPFFFILAMVVIPLYFLVSLLYTIVRKYLTSLPFKKK